MISLFCRERPKELLHVVAPVCFIPETNRFLLLCIEYAVKRVLTCKKEYCLHAIVSVYFEYTTLLYSMHSRYVYKVHNSGFTCRFKKKLLKEEDKIC